MSDTAIVLDNALWGSHNWHNTLFHAISIRYAGVWTGAGAVFGMELFIGGHTHIISSEGDCQCLTDETIVFW